MMSRRAGLDPESVVEAAVQLADANGIDSLSLATLAAQLGVRTPSLYNHVSGLPGLQRLLALRGLRDLSAALERATVGRSGDAAIIAMASAYRAFVMEHPGLYAATVRSPRLTLPDDELFAAERNLLAMVMLIIGSYGFHGDAAVHVARTLRSALHGFATLEVAQGFGIPLNIDASFQAMLQIVLAGLNHEPDDLEMGAS